MSDRVKNNLLRIKHEARESKVEYGAVRDSVTILDLGTPLSWMINGF